MMCSTIGDKHTEVVIKQEGLWIFRSAVFNTAGLRCWIITENHVIQKVSLWNYSNFSGMWNWHDQPLTAVNRRFYCASPFATTTIHQHRFTTAKHLFFLFFLTSMVHRVRLNIEWQHSFSEVSFWNEKLCETNMTDLTQYLHTFPLIRLQSTLAMTQSIKSIKDWMTALIFERVSFRNIWICQLCKTNMTDLWQFLSPCIKRLQLIWPLLYMLIERWRILQDSDFDGPSWAEGL